MLKNIKLILAYDGNNYLGWQDVKRGSATLSAMGESRQLSYSSHPKKLCEGTSIEAELRKVLQQILQQPIKLQAASRTDAGVHARRQVVNFFADLRGIELSKLWVSLNALLPGAIAVTSIEEVCADFHPTLDCAYKEYRYYICNSSWQYPEYRYTSWHIPHPLDCQQMQEAAKQFIGRHDFSAFTNVKKNESYSDHIRTILDLSVEMLEQQRFCIRTKGVSFLYKMVRNIVGTMIYVGRGIISIPKIEDIFANKNRCNAGVTAPAHGLFLHDVVYPNSQRVSAGYY